MSTYKKPVRHGFVLIEALIALLLIGVGLLAISKLQLLSVSGAGEARSRSEAVTLSQKKLEELRNILVRSGFTGTPMIDGTTSVPGTNATYALAWSLSGVPAAGALEQRVLNLRTTWTDSRNVAQQLDLNSIIAWDDPGLQQKANKGVGVSLISPTGDAQRATGNFNTTGLTANSDGSFIKDVGDKRYLLKANGDALLFVPSKDSQMQSFTTISGKIYFDQNAPNNSIPNASNLKVRLSSEGECIYSAASLSGNVDNGTNRYKSFNYTCYVGPGWYGNVGVLVDDSVNGAAGDPTICVGDPKFNNGLNDNTLISANSAVSATRSYRGFKGTAGSYVSTGVLGGTFYGTTAGQTGPFSGAPRPAAYSAYYGTIVSTATTNYFNQDFLITNISGQQTCAAKMSGGATGNVFTQNAGKYFCIAPDNDQGAADVCPSVWPNFENQVGSGNGLILTVLSNGTGSGTVTSAPAGIDCGSTCLASFAPSTSVTLTAAPTNGSAFAGWSGAGCSGTGGCTVTLTAATTVTATFNTTATYTLTVSRNGSSANGMVTSTPAGIACGSTCSANYGSGVVTLTAAPPQGGTFTGWSGEGCNGTGACTVTMTQSRAVTATFDTAPTNSLTVTKAGAGSGSVSSSPAGISSCTASCTASFAVNQVVTLTATPASGGSTFTGWAGPCSVAGTTCTVTVNGALSVTATFAPPVVNYSVTVTKFGAGAGTVTSSSGGINCGSGSACTGSFAAGTSVTLTASASSGPFTGWSGSGCSGTGTCVISSISGNSTVSATFGACNTVISGSAVDKQGNVTVTPSSAGICTMQGGNSVGYDCTITAVAGTSVMLTNTKSTGQTVNYSWPKPVLANCSPQTINFP